MLISAGQMTNLAAEALNWEAPTQVQAMVPLHASYCSFLSLWAMRNQQPLAVYAPSKDALTSEELAICQGETVGIRKEPESLSTVQP